LWAHLDNARVVEQADDWKAKRDDLRGARRARSNVRKSHTTDAVRPPFLPMVFRTSSSFLDRDRPG